jgi:hypothetical protein
MLRPLNLEQLTLFEMEPESIPTLYWEPAPIEAPLVRAKPRRRRRAWLPRLIRWIKGQRARARQT